MWTQKGRTFTEEFKSQMLLPHENGKSRRDIIREYDQTASAFDKWEKKNQIPSSLFNEQDNRTFEEIELIRLRQENKQLMKENDILKQAVLIIGRS